MVEQTTEPERGFAGVALMCGGLACICYSLAGLATWWRLSIPRSLDVPMSLLSVFGPAFFLAAPGVLRRPSWEGAAGLAFCTFTGGCFVTAGMNWFRVNYDGGPPPPWPDYEIFGGPMLAATVVCLYNGTLFMSRVPGRPLRKVTGPLVAVGFALLAAMVLRKVFPPREYVYLQKWEFAMIVFVAPVMCMLAWTPLGFGDGHASEEDNAKPPEAVAPAP